MSNIRLTLTLIGILSALLAPPWVPMLCIVLLSLGYRSFEAIMLGFFVDMIWMPISFPHALPLYTIAAIIIVWGLEPLRLEFLR